MNQRQHTTSFLFGAAFMLAIGFFMGAGNSTSTNTDNRYDASIGLAGLQITDHSTNTLYVYQVDRENEGVTKLKWSVDLTKAGRMNVG